MTITKVWALYFTGTGTTKKIVETVAAGAAEILAAPWAAYDFSLPGAREAFPSPQADELTVLGVPVYAGRVPNLLVKPLEGLRGEGGPAIPIVLFGNRAYDDALIELRDILQSRGFRPCAAGAFVGEHAFSRSLARGRPDEADLARAKEFAEKAAQKVRAAAGLEDFAVPVPVAGTPRPYRGYFQPRDREGRPIDIRKVKPETGASCRNCGLCAAVCTMGSIDRADPKNIPGVCTKCCACVKGCPVGAKFFTDPNYLYHQGELEAQYRRRAEPEVFV